MTAAAELVQGFAGEQQRLLVEIRELDLLIESTKTEVDRLKAREDQARSRIDAARADPSRVTPEEVFSAADEHSTAIARRMTMEGQLSQLQSKRRLLDQVRGLIEGAQRQLEEERSAPPTAGAPIDERRLLQAVVETQEEERARIARQVHDGPAQAMANVVLQSEISERLFDIDAKRARDELAALRQMVNKTLQELRGFIFELRPMSLDDLGLVPTLRRYVQTLVDKYKIRIDLSSTGRDRRLPGDEEIAIFRLLQDSLLERIDKGQAKQVAVVLDWKDDRLEMSLQSDGREMPSDSELASGLRRSERVALLQGRADQTTRGDGTVVLNVSVPVRPAPQLIS